METINLYENELMLNMPDLLLRPGGFELTQRLVNRANLKNGASVADIGCGHGSTADYLSKLGYDVKGIDKSELLINNACIEHPGLDLYVATAEVLPFADSSFDCALFECSLSLTNVHKSLNEANRILKRGGHLLISDVFSSVTSRQISEDFTIRTYIDFEMILTKYGYKIQHTEDATTVFESFMIELIMSTGSVQTLFSCGEWDVIKKLKPKYLLIHAIASERL